MTLPVPLTIRVGDIHVTPAAQSLGFRTEAVGGVKSITFRLSRPLSSLDPRLSAYSRVYVYDARSGESIAEGRLSDTGRGASSQDGQQWDITAFGPARHATDETFPYILVDQRLDTFTRAVYSTKNAVTGTDERGAGDPSLLIRLDEGKVATTSWLGDMINRSFERAGMKLARVRCRVTAGVADANFSQLMLTRTGSGGGAAVTTTAASLSTSVPAAVVVTDFPNGDNVISIRATRKTSSITGLETHWFEFWEVRLRALLLAADGTEITTGYTANTVLAHEVVNDLLGRVLPQFDGAGANVDTAGTYTIDQMAYPDGVTAEQVLNDLMDLEPAYRWTTGASNAFGKYAFSWEPWPTTVRYEASLDDGGDFPVSGQDLYNEVTVRYVGPDGVTRTLMTSGSCPILDDAGVVRRAQLDASDEIGSAAAAAQLGANFLAEHQYPSNAGTLTISRPIKDLVQQRMVRPHEIKPGELIRVQGVESYPDALNASSSDGQTVFRIWAGTYSSDSDSMQLELDTYSRTTANALAGLLTRRDRKR